MAYTPSYEALNRRRRLTDAAVPGRGLLSAGGGEPPDAETISAFASARARELEDSYRARDTERDLADMDAWGALNRRQQRHVGAGNVERYYAENPMREGQFQERREMEDYLHGNRMEQTALQNDAKYLSPYLNYMGRMDANEASRERTRAQYGDPMADNPDAAGNGSGGVFGAIGSLFNRLTGGGNKPAATPASPAQAPAAGPSAAAGASTFQEPQTIEELVGHLKRAYPQASPRDLVSILNDEVEFDDPAELEAATRLLLGLQR